MALGLVRVLSLSDAIVGLHSFTIPIKAFLVAFKARHHMDIESNDATEDRQVVYACIKRSEMSLHHRKRILKTLEKSNNNYE